MTKREQAFIKTVWSYYLTHGRQQLPWRQTTDPYHILVSEVMLQQTQVERVIPKYCDFVKKFPTVVVLAHAPLSSVLIAWQGLGYNRRAQRLHECARMIIDTYDGFFPASQHELMKLPGIGQYTAGAILAFAFNKTEEPIIETNIRSVYLHHFYKNKHTIADTEIIRLIERTLDRNNPRAWYYALMDYGSYLKKTFGNPNTRSAHYTKQSRFKGSNREIRGAILRLLAQDSHSMDLLYATLNFEPHRLEMHINTLIREALITQKNNRLYLSE